MFIWIEKQAALVAFCQEILTQANETQVILAIDTEFMRENTYWPRPYLIQCAVGEKIALIDPLADQVSLQPLRELLVHPQIVKVFHAARQDLEIFWHLFGEVPAPIWDTQIAGMACGYGEAIAYDALVESVLQQKIDKSSRFTDWSLRPLTSKQCHYAAMDVAYLIPIYAKLHERLSRKGRLHWIEGELLALQEKALYQSNPDDVWKKVRPKNLRPKHYPVLQAVARERELEAMRLDIPRSRVLKDEILVELALQHPEAPEDLQRIRGVSSGWTKSAFGQRVWQAIHHARQLPKEDWPRLSVEPPLSSRLEGLCELLRIMLKIICDQQGVAPRLVATRQQIEELVRGVTEKHAEFKHPVLEGWKYELFGSAAADIIEGVKGLVWQNGKVVIKQVGEKIDDK